MSERTKVSDLSAARFELAELEEQLIGALMASGPIPEAVSETQVAGAAQSLLQKRARGIARCHPDVLSEGSESFLESVREYAVLNPGVHPDGPCSDAAEFERFLKIKHGCVGTKANGLTDWLSYMPRNFWMWLKWVILE